MLLKLIKQEKMTIVGHKKSFKRKESKKTINSFTLQTQPLSKDTNANSPKKEFPPIFNQFLHSNFNLFAFYSNIFSKINGKVLFEKSL